jgi:DNA polymerase
MSLMTREDMLRELELLPVWTLRSPLAERLEPELSPAPQIESAPIVAVVKEMPAEEIAEAVVEVALPQPQVFRHIASEEGDYLFVLADNPVQVDEERLLRNIFMAMKVKTKPPATSANTLDIFAASNAKLVIAMGEQVAQSLLQTTEPLDHLRGKPHAWQGTSLVATYDVAHLLATSVDKAKTWSDLCLAMQALQDIKSSSA